ncbi:hypothetical protein EV644_11630 [Kribbella orskensis]|uniref:DUF3558 domain-containing protein n=1 Tax=Kribbella orskensis TaxID=2512216 RepID=A0ABY2BCP4_9ACTN|nr:MULTISPECIES: hypothetical protein [Kribbella]TCN35238.1 hypothetical protein EV642_11730 [Kribbella sp. VKM Ac-2500]TCO16660.1 hypothetical protein EV644_11630 [Kribbella orskensis]
MSASRTRGLIGASIVVAVLGLTAACGNEDSSGSAAQPSETPTTPGTPPTLPTPSPSGTPSMDCPETIAAVRASVEKTVWGKGAAKSLFQPVSVTICQYDAQATGQDYATVTTKRNGKQATELFALVNSAKPVTNKPKMCTKELGPTYVLRFTDNDRGVLSYTAEAFGCRRLVATSLEGQGKPGELASPRQVSPELVKSLGLR